MHRWKLSNSTFVLVRTYQDFVVLLASLSLGLELNRNFPNTRHPHRWRPQIRVLAWYHTNAVLNTPQLLGNARHDSMTAAEGRWGTLYSSTSVHDENDKTKDDVISRLERPIGGNYANRIPGMRYTSYGCLLYGVVFT